MYKLFLIPLLLLSLVRFEVTYHKDQPEHPLTRDPRNITWNEEDHVWVDRNISHDNWEAFSRSDFYAKSERWQREHPERIPVKKTIAFVFRWDFWRRTTALEPQFAAAALVAQQKKAKRRLVLINVEQNTDSEEQYRIWPHLGMNVVGTIADEEGWGVVLWDELTQGHAPLETLVEPGDVVGMSVVVSGMDRSVDVARRAKELGARYVIAGNDAAIFRAKQLLRLPDRPVDAVFTSNSTNAVRRFFREISVADITALRIREVATDPDDAALHSNESQILRLELRKQKELAKAGSADPMDGFVVPRLDLFGQDYWTNVWTAYRNQFGHKHANPQDVRNGIIHLAQGCTRTQGTDACSYCTIFGIGDIRLPTEEHLAATLDAYRRFGINHLYNVTDSAYEMRSLVKRLRNVGFRTDGLVIYGRAYGLAHQPELLDAWQEFVNDRLLVNCGLDSADDRVLQEGVVKATVKGSRLTENRQAVLNLRGSGAHLQFSLIYGSPGETIDSCERNLEFVQWIVDTLGPQCDTQESDFYWLNFGAPAARVFHDHGYAQQLAAIAGKTISVEEWYADFGQHADALSVPPSAQKAWYRHFTRIDLDIAHSYIKRAAAIMDRHPGTVKSRVYAFKPPREA